MKTFRRKSENKSSFHIRCLSDRELEEKKQKERQLGIRRFSVHFLESKFMGKKLNLFN